MSNAERSTSAAGDTATALRKLYADFGRGDMAAVLAACAETITFTVPGRSRVAGVYPKDRFVPGLITTVMTLTNGTFREEVLDVLVGEGHGGVILRHTFERDGRPVDYRTLHLWTVEDGRFTAWRELPFDPVAFEAAWA